MERNGSRVNRGIVFGVISIILFYGGANFYIGSRIFLWLSLLLQSINVTVYACVYLIIALSLIIGFLPLPSIVKKIMSWTGAYWMGIFVYLLLLFLVSDLVLLLGTIGKIIPSPMPQDIRFYAGLIVFLITTGLVIHGIYHADQISYTSYDIQTKGTTFSADIKIVLISDLHLGAINSEKRLERIVQGINNLEPDIVLIAGDIFNNDFYAIHKPEEAIDLLKSIMATFGVYACLGNHDGGNTFTEMIGFLEQSNINLLNDEYLIIDEKLVLFGRVDSAPIGGFGELKRKDVMDDIASLDTNMPIVVMEHSPSTIEEYGREVDLIVAGHTHRGQIFPFNIISKAIYVVDYGHYQNDAESPHVIVTSGVCTWGMPMRIGTNNEIVSILLH